MDKFIESCEEMLNQLHSAELEAIIEALNPLPPEVAPLTGDETLDEYISKLQVTAPDA